jgi:hypothetical protein
MGKVYNLARVSSTTAGTGTITLGAAVSGFLTFALAGASDGDRIEYSINDGSNSEKGLGTLRSSGTVTLSRDNIYSSTNGGAAISLSGLSSQCNVFCDPSAQNLWTINTEQHTIYGGI